MKCLRCVDTTILFTYVCIKVQSSLCEFTLMIKYYIEGERSKAKTYRATPVFQIFSRANDFCLILKSYKTRIMGRDYLKIMNVCQVISSMIPYSPQSKLCELTYNRETINKKSRNN